MFFCQFDKLYVILKEQLRIIVIEYNLQLLFFLMYYDRKKETR